MLLRFAHLGDAYFKQTSACLHKRDSSNIEESLRKLLELGRVSLTLYIHEGFGAALTYLYLNPKPYNGAT